MILTVLFGYLVTAGYGADVTLKWDANRERENVQGYRVYCREDGQSYDYSFFDCETYSIADTTCTISHLDEDITYCFVVRAYNDSGESGNSNEVCTDDPIMYGVAPRSIDCSYKDSSGVHWQVIKVYGWNFGEDQGDGRVVVGPYSWWTSNPLTKGYEEPFVKWSNNLIHVGFVVPMGWEVPIRDKTIAVWVRKKGSYTDPKPLKVLGCDQLR